MNLRKSRNINHIHRLETLCYVEWISYNFTILYEANSLTNSGESVEKLQVIVEYITYIIIGKVGAACYYAAAD